MLSHFEAKTSQSETKNSLIARANYPWIKSELLAYVLSGYLKNYYEYDKQCNYCISIISGCSRHFVPVVSHYV